MDIVTLHINSHSFRLPKDVETEALATELLSAVHTGGALVGISLTPDRHVSVLVTEQSQIVFEYVTTPDLKLEGDDDFPVWVEDLAEFSYLLET
jgi:hypothetical protein